MARKIKALMSRVFKTETDAVHEDLPSESGDPSQDIAHKIKAVMAKVFKIDINDINDDTSPDNVHQWTSLEHVDFVLNLQQEFEIEFTDSQIVEALLSYKTVVETVEAALEEKRARRAN